MKLTLWRTAYLEQCTLGWLVCREADLKLATLEEPWRPDPDGPGGERRFSCVPDGEYALWPYSSSKHPESYILVNTGIGVYATPQDVPSNAYGRSLILIHIGNTVDDTEGCVLVGMQHVRIGVNHAVLDSFNAMQKLRKILGRDRHILDILPTVGTAQSSVFT